jgi:hypothetical protein
LCMALAKARQAASSSSFSHRVFEDRFVRAIDLIVGGIWPMT